MIGSKKVIWALRRNSESRGSGGGRAALLLIGSGVSGLGKLKEKRGELEVGDDDVEWASSGNVEDDAVASDG